MQLSGSDASSARTGIERGRSTAAAAPVIPPSTLRRDDQDASVFVSRSKRLLSMCASFHLLVNRTAIADKAPGKRLDLGATVGAVPISFVPVTGANVPKILVAQIH